VADIQVQPANGIRVDAFPASVDVEGSSLGDQYRVIITDSHLVVLEDSGTGPRVAIELPYTSFEVNAKVGWSVTAGYDNTEYVIKRVFHCGCGSRLRGIHPFGGVPFLPRDV